MTETSKKSNVVLKKILYIYYLFRFQKDTLKVKILIDFYSKVSTMKQAYISKLGLGSAKLTLELKKLMALPLRHLI